MFFSWHPISNTWSQYDAPLVMLTLITWLLSTFFLVLFHITLIPIISMWELWIWKCFINRRCPQMWGLNFSFDKKNWCPRLEEGRGDDSPELLDSDFSLRKHKRINLCGFKVFSSWWFVMEALENQYDHWIFPCKRLCHLFPFQTKLPRVITYHS